MTPKEQVALLKLLQVQQTASQTWQATFSEYMEARLDKLELFAGQDWDALGTVNRKIADQAERLDYRLNNLGNDLIHLGETLTELATATRDTLKRVNERLETLDQRQDEWEQVQQTNLIDLTTATHNLLGRINERLETLEGEESHGTSTGSTLSE